MNAPPTHDLASAGTQLKRLGERLRGERKRQKVTATAAAESAGVSRVTLHRIERGEGSVAMGAWAAVVETLGLVLDLNGMPADATTPPLPARIRIDEYPQLRKLAWQLKGATELTPRDALDLYERAWRHLDPGKLEAKEAALIRTLSSALGGGRLLV
jgi:transcriptional regulator with XRE-family HTH domain